MEDSDFREKVDKQEKQFLELVEGTCIQILAQKYNQVSYLRDQIADPEEAERHIRINREAVKRTLIRLGKVFDHPTCVVEKIQGRTDVSSVLADIDFHDKVEPDHE